MTRSDPRTAAPRGRYRSRHRHGGAGPRHAVVFFGGNALCKRLDKSSDPSRYAGQIVGILPEGYRVTILGYEDTPPEDYTLDSIVRDLAGVLRAWPAPMKWSGSDVSA